MSNHLVPRPGASFTPARLSSRQSRELSRALEGIETDALLQVAAVHADALVASTRMQAAGLVADAVVDKLIRLSDREMRVASQLPNAVPRIQHVIDSYATLGAIEVAQLGWRL